MTILETCYAKSDILWHKSVKDVDNDFCNIFIKTSGQSEMCDFVCLANVILIMGLQI